MDTTTINTVSGIGSREVLAPVSLSAKKAITAHRPRGASVQDAVDLSPTGIALSQADVQSRVRIARTYEIRAEIKAGTFMTPGRIDGTVERLLDILR